MRATGGNRALAIEFRPAVHVGRRRLVALAPRSVMVAGKDVIGRKMKQQRVVFGTPGRYPAGHGPVQFGREFRLVLGPIDRGPGGGIDHEVGLDPVKGLVQETPVGQVTLKITTFAVGRYDFTKPGKPGREMAAQLPAASRQQDSHLGKRSLAIFSSLGADASLAESEEGRCGHRIPISSSSQATLASHSGRYGRVHK